MPTSRTPKLKCLCDQGFPHHVGKYLAEQGHNVVYATDIWQGKSVADTTVLKRSTKEGRVLLVTDHDFKSYTFSQEMIGRSPGVVVFQTSLHLETQFRNIAIKLLRDVSRRRLVGRVCTVSVDKISYRSPSM